ncbi:hypothetical protein AU14_00560 [Marinobacter similis]|uniref:Uncharacterized protein n=1 Tax=Marinobacter similis TaxID=1420916 RepID=W5YLK0_9GAMM|nr:hypothetical protein AU14_00560 [Marinobacter similis]
MQYVVIFEVDDEVLVVPLADGRLTNGPRISMGAPHLARTEAWLMPIWGMLMLARSVCEPTGMVICSATTVPDGARIKAVRASALSIMFFFFIDCSPLEPDLPENCYRIDVDKA